MSKEATAPARVSQPSIVGKLAKFFPDATPMRIPIKLTRLSEASDAPAENTVIEYGTPREVLFAVGAAHLEFADLVRVQNSDGSLDAEAAVVAVQYHSGKTAVAARFSKDVANWIVKP